MIDFKTNKTSLNLSCTKIYTVKVIFYIVKLKIIKNFMQTKTYLRQWNILVPIQFFFVINLVSHDWKMN